MMKDLCFELHLGFCGFVGETRDKKQDWMANKNPVIENAG